MDRPRTGGAVPQAAPPPRRGRGTSDIPTVPVHPRPHTSGSYGARGGRRVEGPLTPTQTPPKPASPPPVPVARRPTPPVTSGTSTNNVGSSGSLPRRDDPQFLVPPPRAEDEGKLVVVLDLDETLIFSRGNRVYERQGVGKLLQTLKGRCEVIVWTAGTRDYALDVIRIIDPYFSIQHCIYRHPMWWNGEIGCTKDLRMLGRPMDRIVLIDNTPEVFRANPDSGILVSDFMGRETLGGRSDRTLSALADIFDYVLSHLTDPKASDVFASHRLSRRTFRLDGKRRVELFTVIGDRHA